MKVENIDFELFFNEMQKFRESIYGAETEVGIIFNKNGEGYITCKNNIGRWTPLKFKNGKELKTALQN